MKKCNNCSFETNNKLCVICPVCGDKVNEQITDETKGNVQKVFEINGGEKEWVATTDEAAQIEDVLNWYNKEFGADVELGDISVDENFTGVFNESSIEEVGTAIMTKTKILKSDIQNLLYGIELLQSCSGEVNLKFKNKDEIKIRKDGYAVWLWENLENLYIRNKFEIVASTVY